MDQPWVLGKRPRGNAQKDAVLALGPWEVLIGLGSWDTHTRQPAHGLSTQGTACPHTRVPEQPPPPKPAPPPEPAAGLGRVQQAPAAGAWFSSDYKN